MTGEQTYDDEDALTVIDLIVRRMMLGQSFKATIVPKEIGYAAHYWKVVIEGVKQE